MKSEHASVKVGLRVTWVGGKDAHNWSPEQVYQEFVSQETLIEITFQELYTVSVLEDWVVRPQEIVEAEIAALEDEKLRKQEEIRCAAEQELRIAAEKATALSAANAMANLMEAARSGEADKVVRLLATNSISEADLSSHTCHGKTALMYAAHEGHTAVVRLLAPKADVNTPCTCSDYMEGWTALIFAANKGHVEVVRFLVENGADLCAESSEEKWTALFFATNNNHVEVVRFLLKAGARTTNEANKSALDLAKAKQAGVGHRMKEVVELLEAAQQTEAERLRKAEEERRRKAEEERLERLRKAEEAAASGRAILGKLGKVYPTGSKAEAAGKKVTASGRPKMTLGNFTSAIKAARAKTIILQNGELIEAVKKGDATAVTLLFKEGGVHPDPNAKDKTGMTALMCAAFRGDVGIVKTLLQNGATKDLPNKGKTALCYARDKLEDLNRNRQTLKDMGVWDRVSGVHKNYEDIIISLLEERRRLLVFGELPVCTLVLGIAVSLLLLGYLLYQFKRRLTSKRRPVDTDLTTDLESGLAPRE